MRCLRYKKNSKVHLNWQIINPLKHEIQLRYSLFNPYTANVENMVSS